MSEEVQSMQEVTEVAIEEKKNLECKMLKLEKDAKDNTMNANYLKGKVGAQKTRLSNGKTNRKNQMQKVKNENLKQRVRE